MLDGVYFPHRLCRLHDGCQCFASGCGVIDFASVTLQAVLWLLFSTLLIFLARRLFTPRRKRSPLDEATEGETLSEISPGQAGRVLYEGNSWRARCEDEEQAIAAHQKVYILRREGNTLIVVPQNILHS